MESELQIARRKISEPSTSIAAQATTGHEVTIKDLRGELQHEGFRGKIATLHSIAYQLLGRKTLTRL